MPIRFRSNIRETKKTLKRWQRKQIPFAASVALNDVAFETKDHITNRIWPNSFPRAKNKRFPRIMFRVLKARKTSLTSAVYDQLGVDWIDAHIEGGTFNDRTIPTGKVRRTASGKISKPQLPLNLRNSFKADLHGRGEAVWQRTKDGLKMMYHDKQSVGIRAVFPFYRAGRTFAESRWPRAFEKAIAKALRTAKR